MVIMKFITRSEGSMVYSITLDDDRLAMMMLVNSGGQVVLYGYKPEHADDGRRYTPFEAKFVLNMMAIGAFRVINHKGETMRGCPMIVTTEWAKNAEPDDRITSDDRNKYIRDD